MDAPADAGLARPGSAAPADADPMVPRTLRVGAVHRETADTVSFDLAPAPGFGPGQFNMLYAFGVGESAISISGGDPDRGVMRHTVRRVGMVSQALTALAPGDVIGVRGPFGTEWPMDLARGRDLIVMAGGIGLAPLRPAIQAALARREDHGRVILLYGARSPEDLLFGEDLQTWGARPDVQLAVTVDHADPMDQPGPAGRAGRSSRSGRAGRSGRRWRGHVGVVTTLLDAVELDGARSVAMVCGPEAMMKFSVMALSARGVQEECIYVSLERNMKCAVGFCGHCQLGPEFICKDGPVFPYTRIKHLLEPAEV